MIEINDSYHDVEQRLIALTRDLILVPSIPSRPDDRSRAFQLIKNHLEHLDDIEVHEYEDNGVPSLVALPLKVKKPKILLCGHVDVIEHPDVSCYTSQISDGKIIGPGAGDMKGALAIMLEVFRSVHTRYPEASLGIAVTSDEETGGESGVRYLVEDEKLRCDIAMIPDGGSLHNVTVEEKGIVHGIVKCSGRAAHAARPWLGDNPLEKLMDRLTDVRDFFKRLQHQEDHWYPTCSVTGIQTDNQQVNRIPAQAQAFLDVRFPPPYTIRKIRKEIINILGPEFEFETIISADPTELSPDIRYQDITKQITGQDVSLIRDDGGSDARFFANHGIPVIMTRPLVGNLHAQDEWIDIKSMVTFYRIYEQYLTESLVKK